MTKEELVQNADKQSYEYNTKYSEDYTLKDMLKRPQDFVEGTIENIVDLLKKKAYRDGLIDSAEPREKRIAELEAQIEKLIDFVLSKTECCDVCPITGTCINDEGTCPYAGILSKGEEAVVREWLMQKISKEIKEK